MLITLRERMERMDWQEEQEEAAYALLDFSLHYLTLLRLREKMVYNNKNM